MNSPTSPRGKFYKIITLIQHCSAYGDDANQEGKNAITSDNKLGTMTLWNIWEREEFIDGHKAMIALLQ